MGAGSLLPPPKQPVARAAANEPRSREATGEPVGRSIGSAGLADARAGANRRTRARGRSLAGVARVRVSGVTHVGVRVWAGVVRAGVAGARVRCGRRRPELEKVAGGEPLRKIEDVAGGLRRRVPRPRLGGQ